MLTLTLILEPCQLCAKHFYTREKEVFFLNTLKFSFVQAPQEGPFQVMFVGAQQQKKCRLTHQIVLEDDFTFGENIAWFL